jgi:hypothetical protein
MLTVFFYCHIAASWQQVQESWAVYLVHIFSYRPYITPCTVNFDLLIDHQPALMSIRVYKKYSVKVQSPQCIIFYNLSHMYDEEELK